MVNATTVFFFELSFPTPISPIGEAYANFSTQIRSYHRRFKNKSINFTRPRKSVELTKPL